MTIESLSRKRTIAYLDILGFHEFTIQSIEDPYLISKLEQAMRDAFSWLGGPESLQAPIDSDWSLRVFSDCVCVTNEMTDIGVGSMIIGLALFQREMLKSGFLIRGAITLGSYYQSDYAIISDGLVKAHKIESEDAIYPRIIIEEEVLDLIKDINDLDLRFMIEEYIAIDIDKKSFILYLVFDDEDSWPEANNFLYYQKSIIIEGLSKQYPDNIKIKYQWLGEMHNWALSIISEIIKQTGLLTEDDVWSFFDLIVKECQESRGIKSMLWADKDYQEYYPKRTTNGLNQERIDWIRQWPGSEKYLNQSEGDWD